MNFRFGAGKSPAFGWRGLCLAAGIIVAATGSAAAQATVQSVVDNFSNAVVGTGLSAGVEVAVVIGSAPPQFFSYGVSDETTLAPPTPSTIYYIGSLSKLFTTNLFAQSVLAGTHSFSETLGSHVAELGPLSAYASAVTLQELADFTSGYPDLAPPCKGTATPPTTGCLPAHDPAIADYGTTDFNQFFTYHSLGHAPPFSYSYSTFGGGLLGLLLGATPGVKLENSALRNYGDLLAAEFTHQLAMSSTFLQLPPRAMTSLASGYTGASATANVAQGQISAIHVTASGSNYATTPLVTITGGNGSGANAAATLDSQGEVTSISVGSPGTGYVPNVQVSLVGGGSLFTRAQGTAVVQNGAVVGVLVTTPGLGYSTPPTVSFSGGRIGGEDAQGVAHIANGSVDFVSITSGGSGYVAPLSVIVAPGAPAVLNVPIWAPASGLTSSANDLATFAAAALGHTQIGTTIVPPAITQAFAMDETAYVCNGKNPALKNCGVAESGLGWRILPAAPEALVKDGGVNGFSSYLALLPSADTAVVVLCNTNNGLPQAPALATAILYGLYYGGLLP